MRIAQIEPQRMNNRLQINTLKITLWSFQWANDTMTFNTLNYYYYWIFSKTKFDYYNNLRSDF